MTRHLTLDDKISSFVTERVPGFVREDYPTFISFMEAFTEFLEANNTTELTSNSSTTLVGGPYFASKNILNIRDVDKTVDNFIDYFRREYFDNIPKNILADKRLLAKNIKDFYRAKGTEKSYKLLFRIMFNEDVTLYYPKMDIVKASDGKWLNDITIRVQSSQNLFNLLNTVITGSISGATAVVEKVEQFQVGSMEVYELFLSSIDGTFQNAENITGYAPGDDSTEYTAKILSSVISIRVTSGGRGYSTGDVVTLVSQLGDAGADATAEISAVSGGPLSETLMNYQGILSGGTGYALNDPLIFDNTNTHGFGAEGHVSKITSSGTIEQITLSSPGANYRNAPSITISSVSGSGAQISALGVNVGSVLAVKITNPGAGYTLPPFVQFANKDSPLDYHDIILYEDSVPFSVSAMILEDETFASIAPLIEPYQSNTIFELADSLISEIYSVGVIDSYPYALYESARDIGFLGDLVNQEDSSGFDILLEDDQHMLLESSYDAGFESATAKGVATIGSQITYAGYYSGADGQASSFKKLQDNRYYQDFSYVLKSEQSIEKYRDVIKKLVHPAGMALFGELLTNLELNLQLYNGATNDPNDSTAKYKTVVLKMGVPQASYYSGQHSPYIDAHDDEAISIYSSNLISIFATAPNVSSYMTGNNANGYLFEIAA